MTRSTAATLAFLLGNFTGAETVHASAWTQAGSATSVIEGSAAIAGTHVLQRYRQQHGAVVFDLLAVWMTDPGTGELLYYGFDTAGFPADPPARGDWQGSDLVLERSTPRGASRLVVTPDTTGWCWTRAFRATGDAIWAPVLESRFTPSSSSSTAGTGATPA